MKAVSRHIVIRILALSLLGALFIFKLRAQQDPHFTMYMFNPLYFNPGYAGAHEYLSASMYYRNQWVGFGQGAPAVFNFSGIVPFPRKHIGLGINLNNDVIGLTQNIRSDVSFSYYFNVGKGKLSMGLSAGAQNYSADATRIHTQEGNATADNSFLGNLSSINPDFGFGVFYKHQRYFWGISAAHLNGPGRSLTGYRVGDNVATLARHYYITVGYVIEMTDKFTLTPSLISRYSESKVFANNFSTDFAFKLEYMQMVWGGISYRSADAMNIFVGVNLGRINSDVFKENIRVGYAFDYTTSSITRFNSGTHEVFVSYDFVPKVKRMMPKFK